MITTEQIKELRDMTGISIMQCKKALEDAGGDKDKALIMLRKKGAEVAAKKGDRELGAGVVQAYIHNTSTVGALVALACETDFVAKNEEFKALAYGIAMQIVATNPLFMRREDISAEARAKAVEVFEKELDGKPEDMKAKILEGKIDAYFRDQVLLEQAYIKDQDQTIQNLLDTAMQKFGEKIVITNFSRFSVSGK